MSLISNQASYVNQSMNLKAQPNVTEIATINRIIKPKVTKNTSLSLELGRIAAKPEPFIPNLNEINSSFDGLDSK